MNDARARRRRFHLCLVGGLLTGLARGASAQPVELPDPRLDLGRALQAALGHAEGFDAAVLSLAVAAAAGPGGDLAAVAVVVEETGLGAEAARDFLTAELLGLRAGMGSQGAAYDAEAAAAAVGLLEAIDPGPRARDAVVDAQVEVLDRWAAQPYAEGASDAADRLARLLDREPAAREACLSSPVIPSRSLMSGDVVLPRLLALRPGDAKLLLALCARSYGPVRAVWLELFAASPAARRSPGERRWAEASRVEALLESGLAEHAFEVLDHLPAALRRAIVAGDEIPAPDDDLEAVPDLRPALALACFATGREREALDLMDELGRLPTDLGPEEAAGLRTLFALVRGEDPDPFARLAGSVGGGPLPFATLQRALAQIARREGFPAFERHFLASALGLLRHLETEPVAGGLPAFEQAFERLRRAGAPTLARLELAVASLAGSGAHPWEPGLPGANDRPEGTLTWLDRRAPRRGSRLAPFAAPPPLEVAAPEGVGLLATSDAGTVRLALGAGEGPSRSYQLYRSGDDGATWVPWLDLGWPRSSRLTLHSSRLEVDGDRLSVEVDVWDELPENHFDDLYLGVARLDLSLAAIAADGDGDGLTDLVERRGGLDPAEADSDGDGLDDGEDPLPTLARRAPRGDEEGLAFALRVLLRLANERITPTSPLRLAVDGLSLAGWSPDPETPGLALIPVDPGAPQDGYVDLFAVDATGDRLVFVAHLAGTGVSLQAQRTAEGWKLSEGSVNRGCFGWSLDDDGREVGWDAEAPAVEGPAAAATGDP